MNIVDINDKSSHTKAADILNNGGILVFPTDTVYGIGCLLKKSAIRKLYKIKNRSLNQPTSILLSEKLLHKLLCGKPQSIPCGQVCIQIGFQPLDYKFRSSGKNVGDVNKDVVNDFNSGKTTIIFPIKMFNIFFPKMILSADNKIGIRLPKYPWLEKLIDQVGPIVASSANKKGEKPPKSFAEINPHLLNAVNLAIKTDETIGHQPSRIYDLENKKFLR